MVRSAGAWSTAKYVVAKACEQIREQIARAAASAESSVFHGEDVGQLRLQNGKLIGSGHEESLREAVARVGHRIEVYAENVPPGLSGSFSVTLQPGTFALSCPGGTDHEHQPDRDQLERGHRVAEK